VAAKSAQDSEAEVKSSSVESLRQLNEGQFQIAAGRIELIQRSSSELRQELEKKLVTLQQGLVAQRENGDHTGEADTLNKIGEIYVQLEEYSQALNLHQQALAIYEKLGAEQGTAQTFGYIGNAYFKLGQYALVEQLFRQKLESLRKTGDREKDAM
jgi:tetratricopeptide (TPR) repeat protein